MIGGRPYHVSITHIDGRLLVSCECPYFGEFGQCKHLWAAVLEADRRNALTEALSAKYLTLEDDLDLDDEDDDPLDGGGAPLSLRPPPPPLPRIPAWLEHLTAIRREIEQKKPSAAPWPRDFELLYVIDLAASKISDAIVIELSARNRKKNGEWSTHKPFRVTPAQAGLRFRTRRRRGCYSNVGGQEYFPYGYYSTGSASATRKTLPGPLALKLIPAIAATGRLRLRVDAASARSSRQRTGMQANLGHCGSTCAGEGEQWSVESSVCAAAGSVWS